MDARLIYPQRLTAIILTLNESSHISDCIASLGWCDQIVVVDSLSSDNTVELAQAAGADVVQSKFENYAQQRNFALDHVGESADWVLFIDADERATEQVAAEVRSVIGSKLESGWYFPRHNYIFGNLTLGAGWYPDYQQRLFRTGCVRYERPVHEIAVVRGTSGYLEHPLIHHNYVDTAHFHRKQIAYTEYEAGILFADGVQGKFYTPYTQAVRHWWWRFVTLNGYRVGWHGFRLSVYMAYYEWLKYRMLRRTQA